MEISGISKLASCPGLVSAQTFQTLPCKARRGKSVSKSPNVPEPGSAWTKIKESVVLVLI